MGGQRALLVVEKEGEDSTEENSEVKMHLGAYGRPVKIVEDAPEEIMLLWGLQQPTVCKPNSFVRQSSHSLRLDACGHCLSIFQSPSSLSTPGVTGAVMWDSGVVLAKFLEHAVDSGLLIFQEKKVVELGSGCGLVGCIAAMLGARVILTDLPDRLRLLRKNVEENLRPGDMRGTAAVCEFTWGDRPDPEIIGPIPDYVLGSDVIYSEKAVGDLLATLGHVCGMHTTVILAGELRNDTVLEFFMEVALKEFLIGRVDETEWHPDYRSKRVAMYILVKKVDKEVLM